MEEMRGKMMIFLPGLHFFPLHRFSLFPREGIVCQETGLSSQDDRKSRLWSVKSSCALGPFVSKHRVRCQPWAACQNIVRLKKIGQPLFFCQCQSNYVARKCWQNKQRGIDLSRLSPVVKLVEWREDWEVSMYIILNGLEGCWELHWMPAEGIICNLL